MCFWRGVSCIAASLPRCFYSPRPLPGSGWSHVSGNIRVNLSHWSEAERGPKKVHSMHKIYMNYTSLPVHLNLHLYISILCMRIYIYTRIYIYIYLYTVYTVYIYIYIHSIYSIYIYPPTPADCRGSTSEDQCTTRSTNTGNRKDKQPEDKQQRCDRERFPGQENAMSTRTGLA